MTETRFGRRDPNARGYYGEYGGKFVPETLVAPVEELQRAYLDARKDEAFLAEFDRLLAHYVGRPTPVYEAARLRATLPKPAARIFLKREDLAHTGAHKINNALGQALLAKRMGKKRVIAETGAGQHGVATATVCALLGLECDVYMGTDDMARQALNVVRMRLLGATVRGVSAGSRTLKDAINEAMRDWVTNVTDSYYLLGSVLGPHPYPLMVREFQSVIGREAREQFQTLTGRLPDAVVACVGGGSNALGIFDAFIRRHIGSTHRRRGGRGSVDRRPSCRALCDRPRGRAAGHAHVRAAGCERQHRADALHFRRSRLRRGRAGARLAERHGARGVFVDRRRRCARGVSAAGANRRDHPGARVVARDCVRDARWRRSWDPTGRSSSICRAGATRMSIACRGHSRDGSRVPKLASRICRRVRAHSRREAHRPGHLRHRRRSGYGAFGRYSVCARSRRRRRARGRDSVLRAARRRPGDSARDGAGPGGRRDGIGRARSRRSACDRR